MRGVNSFRGQNPHSLCLCMRGHQVRPFCCILQYFRLCWLLLGTSDFGDLRSAGGGDLDRCSYEGLGGRQVIGDRTAGLSVPVLGVRRPAVYRWKSSIWITASSPSVSGARWRSGVGPAPRLFTNVLGGSVGQGTSDGSGHKPTARCRCHVVKSADTVTVRYGLGQSLFPRIEVDDLLPAPQAARAASHMSAMGLWHPQTGLGASGPVPVSSYRLCMSCKYCFPEDQIPPG